MIEPAENSKNVYRFLVVIILFAVLYLGLAEKMLGFYNDVEKLTAKQSKEEFVSSVSHIRTQWMRKRQPEVNIQLVGQTNLDSEGELKVLVNEQGFVTAVLSEQLAQCDGLFKHLQSINLKDVEILPIYEGEQVVGCEYTKNTKLLFKYMFLNGIVRT